jgi:signal peptidase I
VNEDEVDESYLPEGTSTSDFGPVEVPEGMVFVMGDNRANSDDSRGFGPVDEDKIVGRAFVLIWPPADMGTL